MYRFFLSPGDRINHVKRRGKGMEPFVPAKDEWRHSVFEYESEDVKHGTVTLCINRHNRYPGTGAPSRAKLPGEADG